MKGLWEYIVNQVNIIPQNVYVLLLSFFFIGAIVLLSLYGKRAKNYISRLMLGVYLFFIYGFTVFFRTVSTRYSHIYTPFWSYKSLFQGEMPSLIYEMIMNVLLFIPLGLVWGSQHHKGTKKQQWLLVFLLGMGLSISIEFLQMFFKKGCFEIDDIIHNTLGCLIGFALWKVCAKLIVSINSHNKNRQEAS